MGKTRRVLMYRGSDELEFDVNPEKITIQADRETVKVKLLNGGVVNIPCGVSPKKVRFSTFLPSEKSPYYMDRDPEWIVNTLETWRAAMYPVVFKIIGHLNGYYYVTGYTREIYEGDNDIYLDVELTEYRKIAGVNLEVNKPATVTVKAGDTLWSLARRYYGDGTKWKNISGANGNIKSVKAGQVIKLP